jgi:hypothetical protein
MPYAEDLNFWATGKSDPGKWIDAAKRQLKALGGEFKGEGFGSDADGRAAFMLAFEIKGDKFKIIWPVLKSKSGNERAARTQAATTLYHYVKAVCLYAAVVGTRTAFFSHFMLSDGRVASEVSGYELAEMTPRMLLAGKSD